MGFWKKFGGSIINAGSSLIGSIAGAIGQNKLINQQIEAQKRENQLNREYNLMLARQQNQWNLEQWQRENDYNSPTSQMARLRAAGLNPDLMYGQGTTGNSFSSPGMTSGAPSEPNDMSAMLSKRSFGQTMQQILDREQQRRMNEAQIDAIKANTNKVNSETQGQDIDNAIQQIKLGNEAKFQDQTLKNMQAVEKMTDAQAQSYLQSVVESNRRIEKMGVEMESLRVAMDNVSFEQQMKVQEYILHSKEVDSIIETNLASAKNSLASANLSNAQAMEITKLLFLKGLNLLKDLKVKSSVIGEKFASAEKLFADAKSKTFDNKTWERLNGYHFSDNFADSIMSVFMTSIERLLGPIKDIISISK
ncbi:MAG: hypothetical protein DBY02_04685 [Coprobacter fastidiosus]|nr:MAG: hypothetical protein DBY02_04685 [Coprobacter fastidiosus]